MGTAEGGANFLPLLDEEPNPETGRNLSLSVTDAVKGLPNLF